MIYEEIKIESAYSFTRVIKRKDILDFANLTGDRNKIHVDEIYGNNSQFGQNIVHGMFIGSLFSTLVGIYCPGENSLYLNQTLNFRLPVFADDEVEVKGTVIAKSDSLKIITLRTEIFKNSKVVVSGEAKVKLLA